MRVSPSDNIERNETSHAWGWCYRSTIRIECHWRFLGFDDLINAKAEMEKLVTVSDRLIYHVVFEAEYG